jgi:aminomethyltransferase
VSEPTEPIESLQKTPLHAEHLALGARMVPFAGYHMPVQYEGVVAEHNAVRTAAGVFDVSHMGEIELSGDGALDVVNGLITNDAAKLPDGKAQYTCACNERGTILDDLIVYRLSAARWIVVCNASNRAKIVPHFLRAAEGKSRCEDASDRTALLAIQGPRAVEIVGQLGDDGPAVAALPPFGLRTAKLGGLDCVVARTGYTGEDGCELFCASGDAVQLWRALLAAGQPRGLKPTGLACRDTLRLEARLSLYGNDIDETTNPLEAGLGWVVKLDKPDFLGKNALAQIKASGLPRKMVGFEMIGRGIARHGYPLLDEQGKQIGVCTSGSPAPFLGKNIGLGYVPAASSEVGTKLWVDCRGRKHEAMIVKTPFYKRPAAKA